ncbi:hypothetical protein ACA910_014300 [Epithemia clementina (nom. ined.)]
MDKNNHSVYTSDKTGVYAEENLEEGRVDGDSDGGYDKLEGTQPKHDASSWRIETTTIATVREHLDDDENPTTESVTHNVNKNIQTIKKKSPIQQHHQQRCYPCGGRALFSFTRTHNDHRPEEEGEADDAAAPKRFLNRRNSQHHPGRRQEFPLGSPWLLTRGETRAVHILRLLLVLVLASTATLVSLGVYRYTQQEESDKFELKYQDNAQKIVQTFQDAVERRLGAINSLSTAVTSFAWHTNQSFPFVTIPDFALRGSDLRIQADAFVIHYMPLVTDENRLEWEEYALTNRFQIDEAFDQDAAFRALQDMEFGLSNDNDKSSEGTTFNRSSDQIHSNGDNRLLATGEPNEALTVLEDGTGFHPRIWSPGAITPRGDEAEGSGPYLPLWQRSPINAGKQDILNWNFAGTYAFYGLLPILLETKQAVMNRATVTTPDVARQTLAANLVISQFRQEVEAYMDDPLTFIAYPVFDSFDPRTKEIAGVLATNIHWKLFFENILPLNAQGYICVLNNSYNQTLSYRVDGNEATYLGEEDAHDPHYDYLEVSASINDYVRRDAGPRTRSYTTVPLSTEYGKYTLRIYPSRETQQSYETNDSLVYVFVILSLFLFTSIVFIAFAFVVERRQRIVMATAIAHAEKAAATERELNEFFSHEIRNPLAAAMSACSFVRAALRGESQRKIYQDDFKKGLEEDVKVIDTSLCFVNDFLRSMLEMHRATVDKAEFVLTPANLLQDVLEPVCTILRQRCFTFEVSCDCPENLAVSTYTLCLKQILLHLGVPATNSVVNGFVRFRAAVVNGLLELYVEDSGPGILRNNHEMLLGATTPEDYGMREGTGIALAFSRRLIAALRGDIQLDENYDSGIAGNPGSRLIIRLNRPPVEIIPVSTIPTETNDMDKTANAPMSQTTVEEPPPPPELPEALSVLVVDDDVMLRKLFTRAVMRVAPTWTVQQADSGESAVRLMEGEPSSTNFAIIFMDQYMPSVSGGTAMLGTDTIQVLRAKGVSCRICGLSANDLEHSFLDAGADCFQLKPIPAEKNAMKSWLLSLLGTK